MVPISKGGVPIYNFGHFPQKLHEIEKKLGKELRPPPWIRQCLTWCLSAMKVHPTKHTKAREPPMTAPTSSTRSVIFSTLSTIFMNHTNLFIFKTPFEMLFTVKSVVDPGFLNGERRPSEIVKLYCGYLSKMHVKMGKKTT